MQNFVVMLLTCSAVMSLIALIYMAVNPLLAKRYSEKGRYYVWLIILVGLIIPFRPQLSNALIRVDVPTEASLPIFHIGNGQIGNELTHLTIPLLTETAPLPSVALSVSWWQIGFAVWLAGLIVFLAFHLIKHYSFVKKVKRWSKNISDEKSLALLQSLKSEMGITRHIRLALCEGIGSPMLLGFAKPQILLPTTDLAQDELRFVIKHELVHFKRWDLFYKCLVLIATAIHWFNPIVYMMAKAINTQCELSCDAEIVQSTDDDTRQQYSETIIGVVRYQSRFKTALSTTFYGGKKNMKNRISSIMTTSKKRRTLWGTVSAVALVSILTVGTIVAFAANNNGYREFDPNYIPDPAFYVPAISARPDHLYVPAIPADEDDLPQFDYAPTYSARFDDYDLPKAEVYEMPDPAFLDVYEMRALVEAGAVYADELPPFALWTREELLDELGHFVELETRHHEMSRDELVARVSRVRVLGRIEILVDTDREDDATGFFEWVRGNYTEQDIAIYVELGASQQLVDRLRAEIAMR